MKALLLFMIFLVTASVSLVAGLRSRWRLRKLMREDVPEALGSTFDRPALRAFFSETQLFRAAVEDRLMNPESALMFGDHVEHEHSRVGDYERRVREWSATFERELDEEDRRQLEERGILPSRVEAIVDLARGHGGDKARQHRLLTELQDLESRMCAPPPQKGYR